MITLELIKLVESWNLLFSNVIFDLVNIFSKLIDLVLSLLEIDCDIFDVHFKLVVVAFGTIVLRLILKVFDIAALFVEVFCFDH